MSKAGIIIFFVALVFAVYFGYQLFGPDGSISQYQTAVEERDNAEEAVLEAERQVELAEKRLEEVTNEVT